jgi:predicted nucleotidyltransferase
LDKKLKIDSVILTGSWANGTWLIDSDVDLVVISNDFARMNIVERLQFLQHNWTDKRPLEAFGYTPREWETLKNHSTYFRDANRTGIRISV